MKVQEDDMEVQEEALFYNRFTCILIPNPNKTTQLEDFPIIEQIYKNFKTLINKLSNEIDFTSKGFV